LISVGDGGLSPKVQDWNAAQFGAGQLRGLQLIWANAGYSGQLLAWIWPVCRQVLTVVKRNPHSSHFEVFLADWWWNGHWRG